MPTVQSRSNHNIPHKKGTRLVRSYYSDSKAPTFWPGGLRPPRLVAIQRTGRLASLVLASLASLRSVAPLVLLLRWWNHSQKDQENRKTGTTHIQPTKRVRRSLYSERVANDKRAGFPALPVYRATGHPLARPIPPGRRA